MAAPSPREPPVTTALFPSSEKRLISFSPARIRALSLQHFARGGGDEGGGDLIGIGQLFRLARRSEGIRHADEFDRGGNGGGQRFGHGAAQAAMDVVVFRRDDGA